MKKKTCTIRGGQPSHQVDGFTLLTCKGCHASKCYHHILSTFHIHSSQAVLVYHTTKSPSDVWHGHHLDLKHDYLESYPRLLSSMLTGSYHPLKHRLAYFALHFSTGDPTNRNTVRGFYDVGGITVSDPFYPYFAPNVVHSMATRRAHVKRRKREKFPRFRRSVWPIRGALGDRPRWNR